MDNKAYLCERCGISEARYEARHGGRNTLLCADCLHELNPLLPRLKNDVPRPAGWTDADPGKRPAAGSDL